MFPISFLSLGRRPRRFPRSVISVVTAFFMAFLLCGCFSDSGSGGGDDGGGNGGGETGDVQEISATTAAGGTASADFDVDSSTNIVSVTVSSPAPFIRFESLRNATGVEYLIVGGIEVSQATQFERVSNTANIPSRDFDPPLSEETYTAFITAADSANDNTLISPSPDTSVTFSVMRKSDPDLRSGTLRLNIFFVGEVGQSDDVKGAVNDSLSEAESIFGRVGISLRIDRYDIDGPTLLPLPNAGSALYLEAARSASWPAVNVFIGGDIADFSGNVFGIAAGIPGAPFPTTKSAVAVSSIAAAGADGEFSDLDIRVLGETIAHESSHFMGLFHPIEFAFFTGDVTDVDPLPDTPTCSDESDCLEDDDLIRNLMFPSPVSDGQGGLVNQNRLTEQQRGVVNQYMAVD